MTMQTVTWVTERRYGNALMRFVMLALAMESGAESAMKTKLSRIARSTEIDEAHVPAILDRLVDDGHLLSWQPKSRYADLIIITFPTDAFPEFRRPDQPIPRPPSCPPSLRRRVIAAFDHRCTYCGHFGDLKSGCDGSPWQIDRIVAGGPYEEGNVTLACRPCNASKGTRPAPEGTLSLADVEVVS